MNRFVTLSAVLLFSTAIARADEPGPVYAGVALGSTDASLSCYSGPCDANKHRFSGKIYLGYTPSSVQFADPNLVNSFELMAYGAGANDGAYAKFTGGGDKIRYRGVGLVDALSYKIDAFAVTGRLGLGYTRASLDIGGTTFYQNRESFGVVAGVGVSYALDNRWTLKADIDHVPGTKIIQKESLNLFTAGVSYRF